MEIVDEILSIGEALCRFPGAAGDRPILPVDEVLESFAMDARIQDGFDLVFLVVVDNDRRRRILDAARDVIGVKALEKRELKSLSRSDTMSNGRPWRR